MNVYPKRPKPNYTNFFRKKKKINLDLQMTKAKNTGSVTLNTKEAR